MVFVLLAGDGFFSFAFLFLCRQGRKGRGNAGGMEEMMTTVIKERGLAFPNGNSWNILG